MSDILPPEEICIKSFLVVPPLLMVAPWTNSLYWHAWTIAALLHSIWVLYLIYRNESYTAYIFTLLGYITVIPTHLSIASFYIGISGHTSQPPNTEHLLMLIPPSIVAGFFIWAWNRPLNSSPFYCKDEKVHLSSFENTLDTRKQYLSVLLSIAAIIGISAIGGATAWLLISAAMVAGSIFLVYQARDIITGLRDLIKEERRHSMRYTFFQIEEIREARSRWWIPRFTRWLIALFKSRSSL